MWFSDMRQMPTLREIAYEFAAMTFRWLWESCRSHALAVSGWAAGRGTLRDRGVRGEPAAGTVC